MKWPHRPSRTWRMVKRLAWFVALAAVAATMIAHAEDCKPPGVARVVMTPLENDNSRIACPNNGMCWHIGHGLWEVGDIPEVICLNAAEHEAALRAGARR